MTAFHPILAFGNSGMSGADFLILYGLGMLFCLIITLLLRQSVQRSWRGAGVPELHHPTEIAFLAGGAPRVAQVACCRLIAEGRVKFEKKLLRAPRLIALSNNPQPGSDLGALEQFLWEKIQQKGNKGLKLDEVVPLLEPITAALEPRLASLGLRPTRRERRKAHSMLLLPAACLLCIGAVRVIYAVANGEPVLFLLFLMILTILLPFLAGAGLGRLSATGKELLMSLRHLHQTSRSTIQRGKSLPAAQTDRAVALYGAGVLAPLAGFDVAAPVVEKTLQNQGKASGDGGVGCGAGCGGGGHSEGGGSGCGGGGCGGGGCGGGGS